MGSTLFILGTAKALVFGACLLAAPEGLKAQAAAPGAEKGGEVAPVEDLMREHGVLRRVFLVYEEILRRVDGGREFPPEAVKDSAGIVRKFIEEYHEKLEEDRIFPRFEKAGAQAGLVKTLKQQHDAGRRLTGEILALAERRDADSRKKMAQAMRSFLGMYRPHAAREDTVLFPAVHGIVSPREYEKMGEAFEDKERALFGEAGFEGIVEQVAGIEKALGIYALDRFTPG